MFIPKELIIKKGNVKEIFLKNHQRNEKKQTCILDWWGIQCAKYKSSFMIVNILLASLKKLKK